MKLSTKGRYAMRAMLVLAINYGNGLILLKDIAGKEGISERYLEHLVLSLKAAGLVSSVRGAHGGFTLTRPPSQIKLMDIMQVTEGSLSPVQCVTDPGTCERSSLCVTRDVWMELKEAMYQVLETQTLQDLVEKQRIRENHDTLMYHI